MLNQYGMRLSWQCCHELYFESLPSYDTYRVKIVINAEG
jgi:hypothetical protein